MTTTDAKTRVLVDTNALIRLHIPTAADHNAVSTALQRLMARQHELCLSRQVLREYASVLTRSQTYTPPIAGTEIARQLRAFEQSYHIVDETAAVTGYLATLLETIAVGGKQVHDANLVATMQAHRIPILFTLNSVDFIRFHGLITVLGPADVKP